MKDFINRAKHFKNLKKMSLHRSNGTNIDYIDLVNIWMDGCVLTAGP